MDETSNTSPITIQRVPTATLSRIVFFEDEMPRELALAIRTLRRVHRLSYAEVMCALAESSPDGGQCHTFGQALTEQAYRLLKDGDDAWR